MATPTIRDYRTVLFTADSGEATSWSPAGTYYSTGQREGTDCIGDTVNVGTHLYQGTLPASVDMRNTHFGVWLRPASEVDSRANGGLRIGVEDAGGNYYDWYVGGNDTPGINSWLFLCVDVNRTPDASSGTPDLSAITVIRITFKTLVKAVGNSPNIFYDAGAYNLRLDICGGSPSDPITWDDIATEIESTASGKAYGMVRKLDNGVFACRGHLNIGDFASGTLDTHLIDEGQTTYFENDLSAVDFHKFVVAGGPNVTTFLKYGDSVGEGAAKQGLSGLSIFSASEISPLEVQFMEDDIAFELNGCTFINLQEAVFGSGSPMPPLTTGAQLLDNSFNDLGWLVRNIETTGTLQRRNSIVEASGTLYGMRILDGQNFDGADWVLVQSRGLASASGTFSALDYESIQAFQDFRMEIEGQYVEFINPVWGPSGTPLLTWTTETGTFLEEYQYIIDVADPAANPLEDVRVYIYDNYDAEPLLADFQIITGSTDAEGQFEDLVIQKEWVNNPAGGTGSTHGTYDERLLKFAYNPFEAAITAFNARVDKGVTLTADGGVEISEANADLVSGTVYEHGTGTAPGNLIAYDNGTIAFNPDDIVVGATSGATGTVRDLTGDSADGTLFLVNRNAISYQDNEDLEVGGVANASANLVSGTGGLDLDYWWELRASNDSLANLYAWQSSKTGKASPDPWVIAMLQHRVRLMQRSGGDFWTERADLEGVFVSERGAGNVLYLTSDGGWEWTPPQQYTLTLSNLVTGSEVRIYNRVGDNDTGDELGGTENSGDTFQYSYEHGGTDIPTIIVVFHLEYDPIWLQYDLTAADATLPQNQSFDRTYSNP